jgi:hypothetical protein
VVSCDPSIFSLSFPGSETVKLNHFELPEFDTSNCLQIKTSKPIEHERNSRNSHEIFEAGVGTVQWSLFLVAVDGIGTIKTVKHKNHFHLNL